MKERGRNLVIMRSGGLWGMGRKSSAEVDYHRLESRDVHGTDFVKLNSRHKLLGWSWVVVHFESASRVRVAGRDFAGTVVLD